MTGYWDPDRERRRKTEFHEILRPRTVGEQMQELPERVKKFFAEWARGGHQGKYLRGDGRMVLQAYSEDAKRIETAACQYDAFRRILLQELDGYKVDFLCHYLMAIGRGQDFGDTTYAVLSLTVEETMKFLTSLPDVQLAKGLPDVQLAEDFSFVPMIGGYRDSLLINFFLTVEAIRRGMCDTSLRNTEEFRLYNWYSGFRTNDNQQRGREEETAGLERLQELVWARYGRSVQTVLNANSGAPDLITVCSGFNEYTNVRRTGELDSRASVTYSNLEDYPENREAVTSKRPFWYMLIHDYKADKWAMIAIPTNAHNVKVDVNDFDKLALPGSFGAP
jgi:hypothetical protein